MSHCAKSLVTHFHTTTSPMHLETWQQQLQPLLCDVTMLEAWDCPLWVCDPLLRVVMHHSPLHQTLLVISLGLSKKSWRRSISSLSVVCYFSLHHYTCLISPTGAGISVQAGILESDFWSSSFQIYQTQQFTQNNICTTKPIRMVKVWMSSYMVLLWVLCTLFEDLQL